MTETIALLDGDIFAYEAAISAEEPINWGDGTWTLHALEAPAIAKMESKIRRMAAEVKADRIIIALSDKVNFRKDILPTYKSNRDFIRRPMLLKLLKEHIRLEYSTITHPNLEADDVLGILATWDGLKGDKVIITKDKDLLTIPGRHYVMHKEEHLVVTEEEADTFHLVQTLMGDTVDGYAGCPGIGETTAWEIMAEPFGWEQYEHTFKSGPRKDQMELRWKKCAVGSRWEAIVSHFIKAGLCEEEALRQARVAKILRSEDYDIKLKEVKLWNPA